MQALRIALAQINSTVGDFDGNCALIVEWASRAAQEGAQVVVFPELAVTGAPLAGFALRPESARESRAALGRLAVALDRAGCGDVAVVVGYLDGDDRGPLDSAAILFGGAVVSRYDRHEKTRTLSITEVNGFRLGLTIGEDLRQPDGAVPAYAAAGVDVLVCLDADPFGLGRTDARRVEFTRRAVEAGVPFACSNPVGGQKQLVYGGSSMVVDSDGTLLGRAPEFTEHLLCVDIDVPADRRPDRAEVDGWVVDRHVLPDLLVRGWDRMPLSVAPALADDEQVWSALVTAVRDHAHKNGFASVTMDLSGSVGSAVVAAMAVDALGAQAVHATFVPSHQPPEGLPSDVAELLRRNGIHIESRSRRSAPTTWADEHGHLVLATDNSTELGQGYGTQGYRTALGFEPSLAETIRDAALEGFAPLRDVPQSLLWNIARWRNKAAAERGEIPPIPEELIDGAPTKLGDAAERLRHAYPIGPKIMPSSVLDRRVPVANVWAK
ncbi:MAG: nitrilase-related carbon-nitrogen hydrolase [Rhodococcus sp. (in: high G+C Gram-positive bacteria)]